MGRVSGSGPVAWAQMSFSEGAAVGLVGTEGLVANPLTLACVGRLWNLVAVDQADAVILRHE